jgi:hypothetical protein
MIFVGEGAVLARRRRAAAGLIVLTAVAFVVGLAGLVALPLYGARSTYLSENALQPGVHSVAVGAIAAKAPATRADEAGVKSFLKTLDLETVVFGDDGTVVVVVRAPRGGAGSCLAISAHFDNEASTSRFTGASFALRLADYLRAAPYVGKDVLFVWTRAGSRGTERFLSRYYEREPARELEGFRRSGPLHAALHLDFAFSAGVRKMAFELEGDRLPNLDLLNSFVRCAMARGIPQRLLLTTRRFLFKALHHLPPRAAFFLQFFLTQALVDTSRAAHAVFNSYACDALTVTHVGEGSDIAPHVFFDTIEAELRCLFALQENLHQSFYFYVLPSASLYVPIGDYMILFGLCYAIFPAVVVWYALFSDALLAGSDWRELEVFGPFVLGAIAWKLPPLLGMPLCSVAAVLALAMGERVLRTAPSLMVLLGVTYYGAALAVCVLANFPLALLGCAWGVLHLAAVRLRSRLLFALADPFLLSLGHAPWATVFLVCVPFRLLLAQSFRKPKTD